MFFYDFVLKHELPENRYTKLGFHEIVLVGGKTL